MKIAACLNRPEVEYLMTAADNYRKTLPPQNRPDEETIDDIVAGFRVMLSQHLNGAGNPVFCFACNREST